MKIDHLSDKTSSLRWNDKPKKDSIVISIERKTVCILGLIIRQCVARLPFKRKRYRFGNRRPGGDSGTNLQRWRIYEGL